MPLSLLAGGIFYAYVTRVAPDRDRPTNARKIFRNAVGLLGISAALLVLLVLPWWVFEGWSLAQVAGAELPYRSMRTTIYAIYASAAAGGLGVLHAFVAKYVFRTRAAGG